MARHVYSYAATEHDKHNSQDSKFCSAIKTIVSCTTGGSLLSTIAL